MTLAFDATGGAALSGGAARAATFEFRAGPFVQGELNVLSFSGREGLSQLFAFDVLFASTASSRELEAGLIGQSATLVLAVAGGAPRLIHGIVASLQIEENWAVHDAVRQYRARLVPAFWRLKQRVNSRIFQEKTIADVISAVLKDARVPVRFDLRRPLPQFAYCVQYQESDYAFVKRLLAEQGWYYYFEPPSGLLDALGLGALGDAAGALGDAIGGAVGEATGAFGLTETLVVSDAAAFYPAMPDLGNAATVAAGEAAQALGRTIAGSAGFAAAGAIASDLATPTPSLFFRKPAGMAIEDERTVSRFALKRTLRPTTVTLRDYLYEHPLLDAIGRAGSLPMQGSDTGSFALGLAASAAGAIGGAVRGESGGGGLGAALLDAVPLPADADKREMYRHQMDHLFGTDARDVRAQTELEQHRRKAWWAEGSSTCRRLTCGYRFSLTEHSDDRLNRGYVVTRVVHRGLTPEWAALIGQDREKARVYENSFTCAPASITVRPRRPPPRAVQVADTAVVVGPAGEEIHTDAFGRIKVQFHWDREGKKNEHSSCWLRVLHTWSGPGWGTQFIPRIGMEVLVLYQQGDPDKPIVIGCAPNALTPQPFWLPNDATRNGIRTQSSPGGGGYNELSFEDRKGEEQVHLYAQRNLDEVVGLDHTVRVGNDQRMTVSGNRIEQIDGYHREHIDGDHAAAVGGDGAETVGGNRKARVGGNALDTVGGVENRSVGGSAFMSTSRDYTIIVGGASLTVVGSEQKPSETHCSTYGRHHVFASDEIRIQSEKTIVLRCGETELVMTPDQLKIHAKTVVIDGGESTSIFGKKPVIHLTDVVEVASDKITLTGKSSSLELSDNATLLGTKVKLGSGASGSQTNKDSVQAETKQFATQLCDSEFRPYSNKQYNLNVGGKRFSGSTDGQGFVRAEIPKDATTADLALWLGDPPAGMKLRWVVRIEEQLPPSSDVRGAQLRLFNMGYFLAEPDGVMSDALHDALRAFQRDHDLPMTGDLDGRTSSALTDSHGH